MKNNRNMLKVIKQLAYDFENFDLQHFIEHIQKLRQRDIILFPATFGHELSAVWVRAETTDYIFYNTIHHTHNL